MSDHGSTARRLPLPSADDGEASTITRADSNFASTIPELEDRTVISSKPLLGPPVRTGLNPAELGATLEGERLGHFELREFIGGGGMGAVFRAIDTMLNRTVAVKVLSSDQSSDEETIRRFKNEAQSAARLDHENIARVYYVGEDRGVHYIVFEHIEGINLRDLVVQQGPLGWADVIGYTLQVAEALSHASQRDVVHRDIKPSNLLATAGGRIKLVDMGLARLHQVEHTDNDLTASGVTLGTFDYISPEQARDPRTADVRSDLYSLGCTVYFMLTARPPFPEGTVLQKLLKHQGDEAPDPRVLRPDVPDELARILAKLLAKNPEARYQTPAELIVDLNALSEALGLRAASHSSPRLLSPPPKEASRWVRAAPWLVPAALLLAAVALLEVLWSRSEEPVVLPEIRRVEGPPVRAGLLSPTPAPPSEKPVMAEPPTRAGAAGPKRESVDQNLLPLPPAPAPFGAFDLGLGVFAARDDAVRPPLAGSGAAAPQAAASTPAAETPPRAAGVLVVAPGAAPPAFATLHAACSAAKSGEIIELRYNGPLLELPTLLVNKRLTIRAGEGFAPRIVFQPHDDAVDPVEYPRSMLTLAGGELTLINLPLELDVPPSIVGERWSLIECRGRQTVSLRRCVLTIRDLGEGEGAYQPPASFFELTPAPGGDGMPVVDDEETEEQVVTLRLKDTIARGAATLVRSVQSQPVDLAWENGLFASSRRLADFQSGAASMGRASMQINLQHVTVAAAEGLASLVQREDAPHPLEVKIKCADSIVWLGTGAALISQDGVERPEALQAHLTWSGDRNFYEGFEQFWKIGGELAPDEPVVLGLDAWQAYWQAHDEGDENRPSSEALVWAQPPGASAPIASRTPDDYALSADAQENPALGAASDGRDVGFRADLLPTELLESR